MDQKRYIGNRSVLRFRRWSRKAYAAFVSFHHVVNIGQLATSVSERFQVKNLSLHGRLFASVDRIGGDELLCDGESEGEEAFLSNDWWGFLCPLLFARPVVLVDDKIYVNYNKYTIIEGGWIFLGMSVRFFLL